MKKELVVFDLYGTLADIGKKTSPYRKLFRYVPEDKKNDYIKNVLLKNFSFLETIKAIDANFEVYRDFLKNLHEEIENAFLLNDALPVLKELKKRGVKTGVISNLASPYKLPFYSLGLNELIDFPVFSCDTGFIKPDKRIFSLIKKKSGLPFTNMIMAGDNLVSDVIGPESVGIQALLLDRKKTSPYRNKICSLNEILEHI